MPLRVSEDAAAGAMQILDAVHDDNGEHDNRHTSDDGNFGGLGQVMNLGRG